MRIFAFCLPAAALASASMTRGEATIVTDPTFFDRVPHTLIDFETFGDGSPVSLPEGGVDIRFGDEYIPQGLLLGLADYLYGNPSDIDELEAAHMAIGSGDILMGFERQGGTAPPAMAFTTAVGLTQRSFGFSFIRSVTRDTAMTLTLFDSDSATIASFTQAEFVTLGQIGDLEYGFAWVTSTTPFRGAIFEARTFSGVFFDDIRYGAIPSPGTGVVVAAAFVAAQRRRRR